MRADNTETLRAAALRRSDETLTRASNTIEKLAAAGEAVTVTLVARHAGVSRSWLYTRPELLENIGIIRPQQPTIRARGGSPASQLASTTSLQRRLELAHQRIHQLTEENRRLEDELARSYGQRRERNKIRRSEDPNRRQDE
jgi:Family of unknown function (DUF6262)